jgi:hypothetical protein
MLVPLLITLLTESSTDGPKFKTKSQEVLHNIASQALLQLATLPATKSVVQSLDDSQKAKLESALKRIMLPGKTGHASGTSAVASGTQSAPKIQLKSFAKF